MFGADVKFFSPFCSVLGVFFAFSRSWGSDVCPATTDGRPSWPESTASTCTRSEPICLNENMITAKRCCSSEGNWDDAPTCWDYQEPITNPCPDNFDWKSNICIFIVEDSTYPPQCPYEENLPFHQYISIANAQILPIWMPVRRIIGDYGIDLLRWIEPTSTYKTPYTSCNEAMCNDYYYYTGAVKDKDCLIYHNSSLVEAVSCDEKHTTICAYRSLPERVKSFCSQSFSQYNPCVQSNYSSHSKCFCQGLMEEYSLATRAELNEPYQNLLYSSLDGMCYTALRNSNGVYVWENSNTTLKYSNWAEEAVFSKDYQFGAITANGWIMTQTENETDCVLYEADVPISKSEIILEYTEQQEFVLRLTNPNSWVMEENGTLPIVYCFTDAASDALISRIYVSTGSMNLDEAQYNFQRYDGGPGNYWCEAFLYPDVVAKSSNKYLLRYNDSYTEEYAVLLNISFAEDTNPITEANIKNYQKMLTDQVQSVTQFSQFQVRVYKIEIDDVKSVLSINFHVANPIQSDPLINYSALRGFMESSLENFSFVNILGVDRCVGIQAPPSVTWPVTPINTAARPREGYCIKEDGMILNRYCGGNYIDGADWSELQESCSIQQSTNATVNLTNIVYMNNSEEYMDQVVEIAKNNEDLDARDIELISYFFVQVEYSKNINLDSVSTITNKLMGVSGKILKESQALSLATDRIVHQVQNIIDKSNYIGQLEDENVFLISHYVNDGNLSAIVIVGESPHYDVFKVYNNFDISEILNTPNLKAALVLSESLTDKFLKGDMLNSRITVTIYKNSNLFNEINRQLQNTDLIIGVAFPNATEAVAGDIYAVYSVSKYEENYISCSYWDYHVNKQEGYWAESEKRNINNSVICTYNDPKHFTIIHNEQVNITHELETLINSNTDLSEKLKGTFVLLTNFYLEFQPNDLDLVSQLLYTAAEANEENLDVVADIINIIVDIPKEVLEKSQEKYNATGKILVYFDQMLQKFDSSKIIDKDNVYAVMHFLTEEMLYGLTISHCDRACNITLIKEESTVEQISLTEKLDTAVLINEKVLEQLLSYSDNTGNYVPKIIILVFFKDSLFIDDNIKSKITTKVVGVSFPNFDNDNLLNGDLSLLYNLDLNISISLASCATYQSNNDESTIEKGFWNSGDPPTLVSGVQCCKFWQPEHFALMYSLGNLTSHLESMLTSNEEMESILERTSSITRNYYEYLKPVDLFIIAQLFSKIVQINEGMLEVYVNIINDIMKISNTVLLSSKENYNATDIILHTFNYVAEIYNETKEIYTDNVALIISLLAETEMYGVKLNDCSQYCQVTILYNRTTNYHHLELNTFDVKVKLSSNLVNTLLNAKNETYNPRLALKIFYSDVLFIEGDGLRNTSQVFGIHFPNYNVNLPSDINMTMELPASKISDDYNCLSWTTQDENLNNSERLWVYQSRPRNNETLTCQFYEQGYFSLAEGTFSYENITQRLEDILNSNMSYLEKLYKAQDVSYDYTEFQPYDIYLFSLILMQCCELNDDGLDMVNVMINNILGIPNEILLESSANYDALRLVLQAINHISNFEESRQYSTLSDQFGLVVCQLNSNTSNGVILTGKDIKCTYEVDETSLIHAENIVASVIVSKEIVAQAMQVCDNPKIIVSVFLNSILFDFNETQNDTVVLGVSIPSIRKELEGDIDVLFNESTYEEAHYGCGYWKNLEQWETEYGESKNSFKKCSYLEATYFTLLENTDEGNKTTNITQILKDIINDNSTTLSKLQKTEQVVSEHSKEFQADHIYLITNILSDVTQVDFDDLAATIEIVNHIMNLSREILLESQVQYDATDMILHHIDRIAEQVEGEARIEKENLAVIIANNISGIFVGQCTTNCSIGIIYDDVNFTSFKEDLDVNVAVILDDDLRKEIQYNSSAQVVVTVYYSNVLFNEVSDTMYNTIGPVIGIVIPTKSRKLGGSLRFYYYTETNHTSVCAFWNYNVDKEPASKGYWQTNGQPIQPSQTSECVSNHTTHFALLQTEKNVTSDLEDLLNSNATVEEKLEGIVIILADSVSRLSPVDIFLISKILEFALEEIDAAKMNITSHIVSDLFHVPRSVLRQSQITYQATDKILNSLEEMTKKLESLEVEPIVRDNFTVSTYDLKETNISGLLLENCTNTQCDISVLEGPVNLTDLVRNKNLHTAIALSDKLLNQIRQSEDSPKLVVTIYFSDVFFNEKSERDGKVSMVCGIQLPGFNESFNGHLYVMFNNDGNTVDYNGSCAFWNFQVNQGKETILGSWKSEVEPRTKESFTICEYNHITHFALLLARDDSSFADANKYGVLDIITAVNSILSIIGIFGILLTAVLFERWRRNTGNQILIHFSIAISIKMVMLYVSVGIFYEKSQEIVCSITGAILHYSILSEFCWMLIIAILQFKRFVEVLGGPPKFVLLKACICGWVFPALPVLLILLIDRENYNQGSVGLCYPSGLGLYLGIWLPIIIIVSINFVIFIFIIYNVFHKKTETRDLVNHEILFQWRLALLLFSMLGLTWLFGFMSQIPGAETLFVYLFCVSATLQGFIMFLFFIVFNKSTRFLYSQAIKLWLYSRGYKTR